MAREPKILEFDTMVGVSSAYTGTKAPIRGVNGGGLPWVVSGAHGELTASGKLELEVTGVVFDPNGLASEGGGNASVETQLSLPQPCLAPIIFVTSPTGAGWFTVTGN